MIFIATIFTSNKCFEKLPCQKISKTLRKWFLKLKISFVVKIPMSYLSESWRQFLISGPQAIKSLQISQIYEAFFSQSSSLQSAPLCTHESQTQELLLYWEKKKTTLFIDYTSGSLHCCLPLQWTQISLTSTEDIGQESNQHQPEQHKQLFQNKLPSAVSTQSPSVSEAKLNLAQTWHKKKEELV